MRISKEEFEEMREKYSQEVGSGKPGTNEKGEITTQTQWIFFDRASIQRVLDESDPEKGGIKFHLTEYTAATAEKYHKGQGEVYNGMLTLVFEAASSDQLTAQNGTNFENVGKSCPPFCETY